MMTTNTRNAIVTLVASASLIALGTAMVDEDIVVPNTFEPGTKALSSEVNENFDVLVSGINTNAALIDANSQALLDLAGPSNTLQVAPEGAPFSSVSEALSSIVDSSESNPYVVLVHAGVYEESTPLTVAPYVFLKGCGLATTIKVPVSSNTEDGSAASLILQERGGVSDLRLINDSGDALFSTGIYGNGLSRDTEITRVRVEVEGQGGSTHKALDIRNSDVFIRECFLRAANASSENIALYSDDEGGPFAQPLMVDSRLEGLGVVSGIGMRLSTTAIDVRDSMIKGQLRAVLASTNGISEFINSRFETLGLNPCIEIQGSASALVATTLFVGGDSIDPNLRVKYVHCIKPNYDPVTNGFGSDV